MKKKKSMFEYCLNKFRKRFMKVCLKNVEGKYMGGKMKIGKNSRKKKGNWEKKD